MVPTDISQFFNWATSSQAAHSIWLFLSLVRAHHTTIPSFSDSSFELSSFGSFSFGICFQNPFSWYPLLGPCIGLLFDTVAMLAVALLCVSAYMTLVATEIQNVFCNNFTLALCESPQAFKTIPFAIVLLLVLSYRHSAHYLVFGKISGFVILYILGVQIIWSFLRIFKGELGEEESRNSPSHSFASGLAFFSGTFYAVEQNNLVLLLKFESSNEKEFQIGFKYAYTVVFALYFFTIWPVVYAFGPANSLLSYTNFHSLFLEIPVSIYIISAVMFSPINYYPVYNNVEHSVYFHKLPEVLLRFLERQRK